ncbi:MAG: sigma-70 family RNA polymerase sigma factor, partial [Planctomycetota bacterium]
MHEFPETDHSLIARVKNLGDGDSWFEFMEIYRPVVIRMAKRRGLQDADANDVMQQVFVAVAGAIERWDCDRERPPFRAWLTTITKNAIAKSVGRRPVDRASGSTSVVDQLHAIAAPEDGLEVEILMETRRAIFCWA